MLKIWSDIKDLLLHLLQLASELLDTRFVLSIFFFLLLNRLPRESFLGFRLAFPFVFLVGLASQQFLDLNSSFFWGVARHAISSYGLVSADALEPGSEEVEGEVGGGRGEEHQDECEVLAEPVGKEGVDEVNFEEEGGLEDYGNGRTLQVLEAHHIYELLTIISSNYYPRPNRQAVKNVLKSHSWQQVRVYSFIRFKFDYTFKRYGYRFGKIEEISFHKGWTMLPKNHSWSQYKLFNPR